MCLGYYAKYTSARKDKVSGKEGKYYNFLVKLGHTFLFDN